MAAHPVDSRIGPGTAIDAAEPAYPQALYLCDFAPGDRNGGAILMKRLLSGYPRERLTILTGSRLYHEAHAAGDPTFGPLLFPTFASRGRWGWGRVKQLADWLLLPAVAVAGLWHARRRRANVIVSVAHGLFFIAAATVARFTGLPFVLFVHDDWVAMMRRDSWIQGHIAPAIFRWAAAHADHAYAISEPMQGFLASEYGLASDVLLPAAQSHADGEELPQAAAGVMKVVFAGSVVGTNEGAIELFMRSLESLDSRLPGGWSVELHLYSQRLSHWAADRAYGPHRIVFHGWLPQDQIREALRQADVLYLPLSFGNTEEQHLAATLMPTKTSDYLSVGRPILLVAPEDCATTLHARRNGFADVVTDPSEDAIGAALTRLCSREYRFKLSQNAARTFRAYHDIAQQRTQVLETIQGLTAKTGN